MKEINKIIYDNQLKIIPHNGVGETLPTKKIKHGGILYHLKRHTNRNLVLLYIDKAIDIQETAENYANVIKEARKHMNVIIIEQICFELSILSYANLFGITGNSNTDLSLISREFVNLSRDLAKFRPPYFSLLLKNYLFSRCGRRTQYEHIAKMLLADITAVDTFYDKQHHRFSLISGGTVGPCWMKDCCIIPYPYQINKKCNLSCVSESEKIRDIVSRSLLQDSMKQINSYISQYFTETYKFNSKSEEIYKDKYYKKFNNQQLIKHIGKLLETTQYWNYERLYKVY